MAEARPNSWAALWDVIRRVDRQKVAPWMGARNTLGVTLPVAIGAWMGAVPVGLAMATGALNVCFSDSSEPYRVRARRMLAATVLVGFAVAFGEACGRSHVLAVAVTTGWAFAAGLLVALSTTAADLGVVSLVTLVVYSSAPADPSAALYAGLLAVLGGLLQTSISLALWRVRRYVPERRALAALYLEVGKLAAEPSPATQAPPATGKAVEARNMVATLGGDRTIEGERYRALLSQAERLRLSLLMLGRLRVRIRREREDDCLPLDRFFEISVEVLHAIGAALEAGERMAPMTEQLDEARRLTNQMRLASPKGADPVAAMMADARRQMDAIAGQLRSAVDLASHSVPEGLDEFAWRESRQPWRLRLAGTVATLRANLAVESAAFRHAVRLAVCVATAFGLARGLHVGRAYWMPMTVAIVLKPDFSATFSRGVLRLAGTFGGLALATGLFHLLPANAGMEAVLVAVFMFLLRCFGPANYGIFVVAVTALVVVLVALAGYSPTDVILARGMNTALGGVIALAAYGLWPTWERGQAPEALAGMLDAYRDYFRQVREAYLHPNESYTLELDRVRQAARLARSNMEASMDRLAAEPGAGADLVGTLSGIVADSHRLVHAIMALEAGLHTSAPAPARPKFPAFANAVEFTLYHLAGLLRGDPLTAADLPDLREAHHELVSTAHSPADRYTLVNVETDRITNSLNTLAEEVLRWRTASPVS
ncbi:MAG: FUSC family protein [Acidobacteria bacterium]|nr:FUSC family protein [Acidobacteriota bacterium]